jgi:hypothetical protein
MLLRRGEGQNRQPLVSATNFRKGAPKGVPKFLDQKFFPEATFSRSLFSIWDSGKGGKFSGGQTNFF